MSNLKPARRGARQQDNSDLQASLKRHGQLQPIVATPDGEVIVGERRRQTLTALGIEPDVRIVELDEVEALKMRLSEEFSKKDMDVMERAKALLELRELLLTARGQTTITNGDLADAVGASSGAVRHLLDLARLPEGVQALVGGDGGQIGRKAAQALARSSSLAPQEKVAIAKKFADGSIPKTLSG